VLILGSLELLTNRPEGEGGDLTPTDTRPAAQFPRQTGTW